MGGIPARFGNQIKTLFDKEQAGVLSKEGASLDPGSSLDPAIRVVHELESQSGFRTARASAV